MTSTLKQLRQQIEAKGETDGVIARFAEILFAKAGSDFLREFDADSLHAMTVGALEFLSTPADDIRIRVYNPTYAADGWESPYTVLELALPDRPFIVDSVRAELRRQGLELFHLLHPILELERDEGGVVTAVSERAGGDSEALELYFVERIDGEARQRELEAAVRDVLVDVRLATDHYPLMRRRAHELSARLGEHREEAARAGDIERAEEIDEYAAFLTWLDADNFVFLGYREYDMFEQSGVEYLQVTEGSGLGILSKPGHSGYEQPKPLAEIPEGLRKRITGGRLLLVTKTNAESTVHRPARMDYIGIKKLRGPGSLHESPPPSAPDEDAPDAATDGRGLYAGERRFVGLFTSKALSTPVEEIPILRRKLRQVLDIDRSVPGSHDFKQIVAIFNSIPREELFWADAERLHREVRTVMDLEAERGVRLTVRPDPLARGLAVMVIMPRDRFNANVRRRIQRLLTERLHATHVDYQLAMGEDELQVRFHFFFTTDIAYDEVDLPELERDVTELTRTWEDHLRERLVGTHGEMTGRKLADRYASAFDERYRADSSSQAASRDIDRLEELERSGRRFLVDIVNPALDRRVPGDTSLATHLKIYHLDATMVLSEVLPLFENLGFKVLEQISYAASLEVGVRGIDIFRVQTLAGEMIDVRRDGARLRDATLSLLEGAESDPLNRLVLYGGLQLRQVELLRGYGTYYAQLNPMISRSFVRSTLSAHPEIARLLVRMFEVRFDPALDGDRKGLAAEAREAFDDALAGVASLPEDRTLRGVANLILSTVRTNFFLGKPYVSFKVDSSAVDSMPEPRPLFEIGVSAPGVEGTHLRGGRVARGGLRWSDRTDDFRTEVLGLMKTQMTKNAVIVPVGSKGGFIVKGAPEGRDELRAYVEEQYRTFIRGLLDLTDNLVDGSAVHPEGLVIYDDPDPYLVVAADKGTATFSDLANSISEEYGFWLGDAFASGGSQGYDHKKEGITARGAWETVKRHFRELGVDVMSEEFTAAGIGDMSGDVFGNGMLYTPQLRLQAAFNHLHIFLDPSPDAARTFEERKRLFELPRSTWDDYDRSLISAGGGIHSRHAKRIELTPEVREMLGVDVDALSGQDLVRAILRMPVDLLWNGGIGTYVKASTERHADVGDSSNDPVRVDANELRARVIGEGGNLGFTQLARIEFARAGGRINTDAIDNSGGVDMSDHEVNIKILLRPLHEGGELSFAQRNRLLRDMTDDVSELVLRNNYTQSLALSLAQRRSESDLGLFESLQEYLAERGDLKPDVEFLPSRRAYDERRRAGEGLTRPELAILLAYAKMGVYRRLLETEFPDEPYFRHYLVEYFPEALRARHEPEILEHPLRREITATQFTNTVVDLLGITFVHRTLRDTGVTPVEVIRAALVALEVLAVRPLLERLFALDARVAANVQYDAIAELVRSVEGVVNWILLSDVEVDPVESFVRTYCEPLATLREALPDVLPAGERENYRRRHGALVDMGLEDALAADVASLDYLPSSLGVVDVSHGAGVSIDEAARAFYGLGERLALGWLRDRLAEAPPGGRWERIATGGTVMDLRRVQAQLTRLTIEGGGDDLERFLQEHPRLLRRYDDALHDVRTEGVTLASAGVMTRILKQIVEESRRAAAAARD